MELTELAGIRSLADELAWVTSHKFRKTTATILDEAPRGQTARSHRLSVTSRARRQVSPPPPPPGFAAGLVWLETRS